MIDAKRTATRPDIRIIALPALLAVAMAGCKPGGTGSEGKTALKIDGESATWVTRSGPDVAQADARFNRHGVATAILMRARDGDRYVELHATFLGQPSEPVFLNQKVGYRDAHGTLFERTGPRAGDDEESGIRWDRLELDEDNR